MTNLIKKNNLQLEDIQSNIKMLRKGNKGIEKDVEDNE